jgi:hypothetical protein
MLEPWAEIRGEVRYLDGRSLKPIHSEARAEDLRSLPSVPE